MAPQLTSDQKLEAINLFNVARLVGRNLNCSASTVKRWVDKWEIEGTIERKVGSGLNSKKTTAEEDETLLLTALENRRMTPKAIAENCELDICEKTVRSRLKSFGLKRRIAAQKEKLTENHIRNRLNFAENYLNLNFEDWSEFIFTGIIIEYYIKML